jgi:hypothetical protein
VGVCIRRKTLVLDPNGQDADGDDGDDNNNNYNDSNN